jgi:hypothetical protein
MRRLPRRATSSRTISSIDAFRESQTTDGELTDGANTTQVASAVPVTQVTQVEELPDEKEEKMEPQMEHHTRATFSIVMSAVTSGTQAPGQTPIQRNPVTKTKVCKALLRSHYVVLPSWLIVLYSPTLILIANDLQPPELVQWSRLMSLLSCVFFPLLASKLRRPSTF